jgi:hypothetical protein
VATFLAEHPADIDCACFVRPVLQRSSRDNGIPLDARQVADNIGLPSVELVNAVIAAAGTPDQ